MVERCTRTQLAYASVEENTLQNRLTDKDMRGEYIHLPGGWTPTQSSNPTLYRSLRHAWHWHTLLDVGADALAQYKLFPLDQPDMDGDIVDADTRLTYLHGSDSVWLQGAEDMLEIAAKQAAVLVEHDDDGAMEPLLAGAHAEQFPLFQLMRLTARVVQEALTHTWIQTDRFNRFLSDITKEAHNLRSGFAKHSRHAAGTCMLCRNASRELSTIAVRESAVPVLIVITPWQGPGARPASVAHCDASDPAVCSDITHIDGQAPNLQAILACTCHCRPTEVYHGPEVSFTYAVKHIRYRGQERHCLTERTLAETDSGAVDFIMSHKNWMQPLEDLERGMGVPEEDRPYMEQYHGYMFGSDTTHRGPAGAPFELPGGKPCPKCHGRGNVRLYGQGHLLGLPGCGRADDPTQYTPLLAAYNEALYPHITPRSDAAENRNHELAAQYVAHFGNHAVLPNHLYSVEDYASIHARAKELRLVVEAAAPAAAAAASIPP
eukprot:jgi/Tetstr1/443801/TSEL_031789.t1